VDCHGVDITMKDPRGWTALTLAAMHYNSSMVALLLERSDVEGNPKDNDGKTILELLFNEPPRFRSQEDDHYNTEARQ
jgi:ankyrin repeat protein